MNSKRESNQSSLILLTFIIRDDNESLILGLQMLSDGEDDNIIAVFL